MTTQQLALISPNDSVVGLLSRDNGVVRLVPTPGAAGADVETALFLQRHPDAVSVKVDSQEHALQELDAHVAQSKSLDAVLCMLKFGVSAAHKRRLANELAPLLASRRNIDYVLDILLARPLPPSADVVGAAATSEGNPVVVSLFETLANAQPVVQIICSNWDSIERTPPVASGSMEEIKGAMLRRGVFRRLALEVKDQAGLNDLIREVIFEPSLTKRFKGLPLILQKWTEELKGSLPKTRELKPDLSRIAAQEVELEVKPDRVRPGRVKSWNDALSDALSQINHCVNLFAEGSDKLGFRVVNELIESQLTDKGGEIRVVKSLSNIASKSLARGRPDIAREILLQACKYKGADFLAVFQLGNDLRECHEFTEAIECYKWAESLAANEDDHLSVSLAKIHIETMLGRYEHALGAYLSIPDFDNKPTILTNVGDLYRKMGDYKQADRFYRKSVKFSQHRASAGLAELQRQMGRPHRAIELYNQLLKTYSDDLTTDSRAFGVYNCAKAYLLRLTNQYEKALVILNSLYNQSPFDLGVNVQLAAVYETLGESVKANFHQEKINFVRRNLSLYLLRVARAELGTETSIRPFEIDQMEFASIAKSIPREHVGAYRCATALVKLADADPSGAKLELGGVEFVDRTVEDLSKVILLHVDASTSGVKDKSQWPQRLCVIAKRGHKLLRSAIAAILAGDYEAAKNFEFSYLLQIAA